ncbi:MAG: hypothetical protein HQM08_27320 [Candidatus Riflebacteria bacterium]|nr:hypothetical protein [Candidatus Riflebacteria bacterium]
MLNSCDCSPGDTVFVIRSSASSLKHAITKLSVLQLAELPTTDWVAWTKAGYTEWIKFPPVIIKSVRTLAA